MFNTIAAIGQLAFGVATIVASVTLPNYLDDLFKSQQVTTYPDTPAIDKSSLEYSRAYEMAQSFVQHQSKQAKLDAIAEAFRDETPRYVGQYFPLAWVADQVASKPNFSDLAVPKAPAPSVPSKASNSPVGEPKPTEAPQGLPSLPTPLRADNEPTGHTPQQGVNALPKPPLALKLDAPTSVEEGDFVEVKINSPGAREKHIWVDGVKLYQTNLKGGKDPLIAPSKNFRIEADESSFILGRKSGYHTIRIVGIGFDDNGGGFLDETASVEIKGTPAPIAPQQAQQQSQAPQTPEQFVADAASQVNSNNRAVEQVEVAKAGHDVAKLIDLGSVEPGMAVEKWQEASYRRLTRFGQGTPIAWKDFFDRASKLFLRNSRLQGNDPANLLNILSDELERKH